VASREGRIEAADGGTLFLDEIGDLALPLQVKLLRVLQERIFFRVGSTTPRSVDIRVIAATHRQVEAEVKAGRFREDLFYRLNVLRIEISPLRERPEDVAPLAKVLLARSAAALGRPDPGLAATALAVLGRAPWPGNAREIGNVLERALVLREPAAHGPLAEEEIVAAMSGGGGGGSGGSGTLGGSDPRGAVTPVAGTSLPDKVLALERTEIVAAMRATRGVKARAAKMLGLSRPTLDKKITDLGIDVWSEDGRGSSR
jgi:sigma-54 specific flagellar transcriptional regulator A